MKNKGGRPTVMTPECINKLEYAFSLGCSDTEACLHADITPASLYNYQEKNPAFIERKQCLKDSLVLLAREGLRDDITSKDKYIKNNTVKYVIDKKDGKAGQKVEITGNMGVQVIRKVYDETD